MITVGVSVDGRWVAITDGNITVASLDGVKGFRSIPVVTRDNLHNSFYRERFQFIDSFLTFCDLHSLTIIASGGKSEAAKNTTKPVVITTAVGAALGGVVGACLGGALASYLFYENDLSEKSLQQTFDQAVKNANEWIKFDQDLKSKRHELQLKTIAETEKHKALWKRYYKLENIESLDSLSGIDFENAITKLYIRMGYNAYTTKASGDFGVDVIATKGKEKLAIQAKRYKGNVGIKAVQEVISGAMYHQATKSYVITNSTFTKQAKELAKSTGVHLIGKAKLADMWNRYYGDQRIPPFDEQEYRLKRKEIYKALYPNPNKRYIRY